MVPCPGHPGRTRWAQARSRSPGEPGGPEQGQESGQGQGGDMSGDPGTISGADDARGVPDPIRVLIVDDHALFRRGLEMVLTEELDIELVGEASDGRRRSRRRARRCRTWS